MVGAVVSFALEIPIALAMVFGALISATDPVAVIAFFRTLGVDKRLSILMEGESLINDGVAVVLFTLAVAAAGSAAAPPTLLEGLFEFVRVAGGGILVGLATGLVAAQIVSRLDDRLVETTLSMALAFGSFVVAQSLGVSGILAVLTAGLVIGSLDLQKLSPTTRITLYNFWDLLAFVANSAVFLILGLQIDITGLLGHAGTVVVAVLAILASRAIVVYGMAWLSSRGHDPIPLRYRHVMFWGGLRGAVSLALALSLTGPGSERPATDDLRRGALHPAGAGPDHRAVDQAPGPVQPDAHGRAAAPAGASVDAARQPARAGHAAPRGVDRPADLARRSATWPRRTCRRCCTTTRSWSAGSWWRPGRICCGPSATPWPRRCSAA